MLGCSFFTYPVALGELPGAAGSSALAHAQTTSVSAAHVVAQTWSNGPEALLAVSFTDGRVTIFSEDVRPPSPRPHPLTMHNCAGCSRTFS